jgi:hypothetical protein
MKRQGLATKAVWIAAALVLCAAVGFGVWWQWSYAEDPVEARCVTDAEAAVSGYLGRELHPTLGNFERLTGTGFYHSRQGTPGLDAIEALTADRTAHFTNGDTGVQGEALLKLIIIPAGRGDDPAKAAVKSVEDNGTRFILTHPGLKG